MEKKSKNRIWELDALRGLCILLMLFDHFMFNLSHMVPYVWYDKLATSTLLEGAVSFARDYWALPLRNDFVWQFVVGLFFFISGVCTEFSRSNAMRAVKLTLVALLITVVTGTLDHVFESTSYLITAGVIHTFATCALVHAIITVACTTSSVKVCNLQIKIKHICFFAVAVTGVILAVIAPNVAPSKSYFAFLFGFPATGFRSADYIPVLPWISVFMAGAMLSTLLYREKRSHLKRLDGKWNRPLCFVGRTSLWFYVFHQPVIYALTGLIGLILFGELRIF